jgi:predicted transcriptional regulator
MGNPGDGLAYDIRIVDLAAVPSVGESAGRHQLRLLEEMELVQSRREGKMMYHDVASEFTRLMLHTA